MNSNPLGKTGSPSTPQTSPTPQAPATGKLQGQTVQHPPSANKPGLKPTHHNTPAAIEPAVKNIHTREISSANIDAEKNADAGVSLGAIFYNHIKYKILKSGSDVVNFLTRGRVQIKAHEPVLAQLKQDIERYSVDWGIWLVDYNLGGEKAQNTAANLRAYAESQGKEHIAQSVDAAILDTSLKLFATWVKKNPEHNWQQVDELLEYNLTDLDLGMGKGLNFAIKVLKNPIRRQLLKLIKSHIVDEYDKSDSMAWSAGVTLITKGIGLATSFYNTFFAPPTHDDDEINFEHSTAALFSLDLATQHLSPEELNDLLSKEPTQKLLAGLKATPWTFTPEEVSRRRSVLQALKSGNHINQDQFQETSAILDKLLKKTAQKKLKTIQKLTKDDAVTDGVTKIMTLDQMLVDKLISPEDHAKSMASIKASVSKIKSALAKQSEIVAKRELRAIKNQEEIDVEAYNQIFDFSRTNLLPANKGVIGHFEESITPGGVTIKGNSRGGIKVEESAKSTKATGRQIIDIAVNHNSITTAHQALIDEVNSTHQSPPAGYTVPVAKPFQEQAEDLYNIQIADQREGALRELPLLDLVKESDSWLGSLSTATSDWYWGDRDYPPELLTAATYLCNDDAASNLKDSLAPYYRTFL